MNSLRECEKEVAKLSSLLEREVRARKTAEQSASISQEQIKRTEEALREVEARFRATLDNAAQAITLTNDKGRFTLVNAAWEKMFGYTAEEALELTHLDLTHPDFLQVSEEKLMALTRGDLDFYRMEKQYVRKDGTVFWADLSVTPVRGP